MRLPLLNKYLITTTLECYNNNLSNIQNFKTSHIKINKEIVTFYSNTFIDIEGFNNVNRIKIFFKNKKAYYLILLISLLSVLFILFASPYYIKEVKYQNGSIKDDVIFNEITSIVKNKKKIDLNELSKQMMLKYSHYSWIGLKKQGNIVYLNIELNEFSGLNYFSNTLQGDLISAFDAYIKHIIVTKGKVNVGINQVVKKGDLLVSGNLLKQKIAPCGIIIGEIVYYREIKIDKNIQINSYTGNLIKYRYLKLKEKDFKKLNNPYTEYKTSSNKIFSVFDYINYIDETVYEMGNFQVQYNKEDALIYGKSVIYYELEKQRTSNKEKIISIDVIDVTETNNQFIIKFVVKADKNIVLLKQ